MKIAVIGPTFPYKGGISHFTTILVQTLRKEHKVDFLSWKRQYPSFLYPVELKDTQSKHPIKTEAKFILDFFNPISWITAFLQIRKIKAELLILTWVSPIQAPIYFIIAFLTRKFTATKILYICHNVLPHEKSFYDIALVKLALNQGNSYIVHAKEDKKVLEKIVKNKKIILGFHPIYDIFNTGKKYNILQLKKELGLRKKVLLFFGYIRPYKGLRYLIEAMPEILKAHFDTSLLVVGDFWSKDKQSYFDLIKKLNLEKDLIMINRYIPNEEVEKYFYVADIVVLPYITATQSGITQIARAFNKPVITTSVGGLGDNTESKNIDLIIKPKDNSDIAEKVKLFFKKPVSPENIMKYKEKRSWKKYVNLLYSI